MVYGSPYDEEKQEFINELENLLDNWDGPTVIGGDFNLVCNVKDKSNGVINHCRHENVDTQQAGRICLG